MSALLVVPIVAAAQAPVETPAETPVDKLPQIELTPQLLYQMLLAEIAGGRGDIQVALSNYIDLARSTRDPRIVKRAAELALYARQPATALEMGELWVAIDPNSSEARQMLAGLLLAGQRLDDAAVHIAKLLTLESAHVGDGLLRLNHLFSRYSDKKAVARLIDRLTEPYPQLPEAHLARAQAAVGAGDDARAILEIDRAQALRPEWQQAVIFKAQMQQRTDSAKALATLTSYLETYPRSREVRFAYARMLVGAKRYEDARKQFALLLEDAKDDPEAIYAVALLSLQVNDLASAEAQFKHLLEVGFGDPNIVRLYLGQIAEEGRRYQEALKWYGQVTPGEQFLSAQIRAAKVAARDGHIEDGRALLRRVAAANPREAIPLLIVEAQLLRDAGRVADAYDLLEGKLAAEPTQSDLLYETALLAEKLGRFDVLERNLGKLIELQPEHAQAYNALGYSLADRNVRLDEAQRLIDKALSLSPGDAFILDSKGWVTYRRGDIAGALGYLTRAYKERPDPEIAAHLGEVLWMLGRRDEANQTWAAALHANPGNEALEATMKKFKSR